MGFFNEVIDGIADTVLPSVQPKSQINVNGQPIIKQYMHGKAKTILPSWNFDVYFKELDIFQNVKPFHVTDVSVPTYNFKQNTIVYGNVPKSFATFDAEKSYQFSVTFEEDIYGTITALANAFQQRIMRETGVYQPLPFQNLGDCYISVYDNQLQKVMMWTMNDVRFLGTEDVSLAYTTSDALKIKMTFTCDVISHVNYKADLTYSNIGTTLASGSTAASGTVPSIINRMSL